MDTSNNTEEDEVVITVGKDEVTDALVQEQYVVHTTEDKRKVITDKTKLVSRNTSDYGATINGEDDIVIDETEMAHTLWLMKRRQYFRMSSGSVKRERSSFSFLLAFAFLLLYGNYLLLQILYFGRSKGYILEFIFMAVLSLSCIALIPRLPWLLKCIMFEGYLFVYLFFLMDLYNNSPTYIPLGIAFGILFVLTFFGYLLAPYLLRFYIEYLVVIRPKVSKKATHGGQVDYKNVRIELVQSNWLESSQVECVYQGAISPQTGQPHGFGTWIDTSAQGELLQGWWENGVPVGPFESLENGTKSMLVNLRVIYATNSGGSTSLTRVPLSYGVASVESCVSGGFFKGYPTVSTIIHDECQCETKRCTCIPNLLSGEDYYRHLSDIKDLTTVTVSIDKNVLSVSGHRPVRRNQKDIYISLVNEDNSKKLVLDESWISSNTREGLLFLHGYDHNLNDSLKRFGQFLALGHFPSNIKPFVFNWPSSTNPLFYWCAHSVASDNDIHRDLKRFLKSLRAAGIRHLHIMCHSMGTRFFLRAFSTIKDVFNVRLVSPRASFHSNLDSLDQKMEHSSSGDGINLVNLMFLNPDYELETFKNDYEELISYCSKMTIYADHRDAAVRLAFKMSSKPSLGNNIAPIIDHRGNLLEIDLIDTGDLDRNTSSSFHSFFQHQSIDGG